MSKALTFFIGAVLGLVLGAATVFYLFGGASRAAQPPGDPIQTPDPSGLPAGTASVVLNQQFFDTILQTIFRDMNAPAFPLNLTGANLSDDAPRPQYAGFALQSGGGCDGKITLQSQGGNVTTGIRLENGKITAPLAFSGSTSILGQCVNFAGWAQANFALRYDAAQQTVFGQINVETVNLDGISPLVSGFVTPLVQNTINQRVNPIVILRGQQLALNLPIAATDGTLKANVKDVRADIKENALNLYVTYDFAGTRGN